MTNTKGLGGTDAMRSQQLGFRETALALSDFIGHAVQADVRTKERGKILLAVSGIASAVEVHGEFAGMPGTLEPQGAIFLRLDRNGAGIAILEEAFREAVSFGNRIAVYSDDGVTTLSSWLLLG